MTTRRKIARQRPDERAVRVAQQGVPVEQQRAQARQRKLSKAERIALLEGAERVFEGVYTHLPLKRARYGFDPVQRLRILHAQLADLDDGAFNFELSRIFAELRDWHTYYERAHQADLVAVLPFVVEMYGDIRDPHYIVSKVGRDLAQAEPQFVPGVEITTWNFVPIDRVVLKHGEMESGGRPDSQRAMALTSLTKRPLRFFSLPDEQQVRIGYRATDARGRPVGPAKEVQLGWCVIDTRMVDRFVGDNARKRNTPGSRVMAINPVAAAIKKAKLMLYAPDAMQRKKEQLPYRGAATAAATGVQSRVIDTRLQGILRAAEVAGPGGPYGYLRIFTFDVPRTKAFLKEVARLLALLPQRGLIVDIRDNPGGVVVAAEMALQFFTPRAIEPVRFSMLATDFTRQFSRLEAQRVEYEPWSDSLAAAVRNGELYSRALPITDPRKCNFVGQVYGGPVVLVADATTYSSGDLFSAGFVDNAIGPFVCVGRSTGAGGACVWDYAELSAAVAGSSIALPELPDGAGISFSLMRATRAGRSAGSQIEDVGVPAEPAHAVAMTRADLLEANRDLLAWCIGVLRKQPVTQLDCAIDPARRTLKLTTRNLDQIDISLDGRALASRAASPQSSVRLPAGTRTIEVLGLRKGELKQRRLIDVPAG